MPYASADHSLQMSRKSGYEAFPESECLVFLNHLQFIYISPSADGRPPQPSDRQN